MKRYLFLILFIGILVGANIYLSARFNHFFSIENRTLLRVIFPLLSASMIFGVMPFTNSINQLGHLIYIFSATMMGFLLYLLLSVFTVDLISIFTNFSPRITGIAALSLVLMVSLYGIINSWVIQVTKKNIEIRNLSKEIRAVHVSDIHLGHFRGKKFLQRIVDKTNNHNPDLVFITGDLFDGRINLSKETLQPLTQLKAPVYFTEGNHDKYSGVQTIKAYLRELGINVLENEITNWNGIQVIGLNHMRADNTAFNIHISENGTTIKSVLENLRVNKSKPAIMLHHSPEGIQYASENGVDLYLAGHTHAGQLFPVKYIADLIFDFNKGWHRYNGTQLFVSQGVGTFGPPMRVGTKSEIVLLTLKPQTI